MYICHNEKATIFSRMTLRQLGMIGEEFAKLPPTRVESCISGCYCPTQTGPPPLPTKMPFPSNDDNRANLEQWIRNCYAASAFNTCPYQPLQEMTGKPLDIVFKEGVRPVAVHMCTPPMEVRGEGWGS